MSEFCVWVFELDNEIWTAGKGLELVSKSSYFHKHIYI